MSQLLTSWISPSWKNPTRKDFQLAAIRLSPEGHVTSNLLLFSLFIYISSREPALTERLQSAMSANCVAPRCLLPLCLAYGWLLLTLCVALYRLLALALVLLCPLSLVSGSTLLCPLSLVIISISIRVALPAIFG